MIRQQNVVIVHPINANFKYLGCVGFVRWDASLGARINDLSNSQELILTIIDRYEQPHRINVAVHELAPSGDAFDYSIEENGPTVTEKPSPAPVDNDEIETAETGVKPLKLMLSQAMRDIIEAKAELLRKAAYCDECLVLLDKVYAETTTNPQANQS